MNKYTILTKKVKLYVNSKNTFNLRY